MFISLAQTNQPVSASLTSQELAAGLCVQGLWWHRAAAASRAFPSWSGRRLAALGLRCCGGRSWGRAPIARALEEGDPSSR